MSQTTDIAWCDYTASPWFGCTEVDPCCVNCYAREMTLRYRWADWGKNSPRVQSKGFRSNAAKWNTNGWICDECGKFHTSRATCQSAIGHRPRIFPSLMDWLDDQVPIEWLADFLEVIFSTPNLDWLLLTKRPENWARRILEARDKCLYGARPMVTNWLDGIPPANVWFGYTAGTRQTWIERYEVAADIPAKVLWCSAEPLLSRFGFEDLPQIPLQLDWLVVGGESGPKRRDCGVEAIERLATDALSWNTPVFVKQDCAPKPGQQGRISNEIWSLKQFPINLQ